MASGGIPILLSAPLFDVNLTEWQSLHLHSLVSAMCAPAGWEAWPSVELVGGSASV